MFQDKTIVCKDCGAEFVFTAGEQEFYADKGFQNEPQRCKDCRSQKKAQRSAGPQQRTSYEAVCAQCGATTTVPFVPKDDRPVYCEACFKSRRNNY
ncbi:MAG: zinc-ribbon domain containing protein [Clostridia bacterium]|nr:zinc-ribbon domain containing protein [Clostridia bacterium]